MAKEISKPGSSLFEQIKKTDEIGNEYWNARDLSKVLEYSEYRHFLPVIDKAREACRNSGHRWQDHIEDILDMIEIGFGAERGIEDVELSRYACYLILQYSKISRESNKPTKPTARLARKYGKRSGTLEVRCPSIYLQPKASKKLKTKPDVN